MQSGAARPGTAQPVHPEEMGHNPTRDHRRRRRRNRTQHTPRHRRIEAHHTTRRGLMRADETQFALPLSGSEVRKWRARHMGWNEGSFAQKDVEQIVSLGTGTKNRGRGTLCNRPGGGGGLEWDTLIQPAPIPEEFGQDEKACPSPLFTLRDACTIFTTEPKQVDVKIIMGIWMPSHCYLRLSSSSRILCWTNSRPYCPSNYQSSPNLPTAPSSTATGLGPPQIRQC